MPRHDPAAFSCSFILKVCDGGHIRTVEKRRRKTNASPFPFANRNAALSLPNLEENVNSAG